jgi:hypothetical protein
MSQLFPDMLQPFPSHLPTLQPGKQCEAPTSLQAEEAAYDLDLLFHGEVIGQGRSPTMNPFVMFWLEGMWLLLHFYTNPHSATHCQWGASAIQAAIGLRKGRHCAHQLCVLSREYIINRSVLPVNPYGEWNQSMLADESLVMDVELYHQDLGKDIMANKVVEFLGRSDVVTKHGITKKIGVRTARHYLNSLGYRFKEAKKGQYGDGHEQADGVQYRDHMFLPKMLEFQGRTEHWSKYNEIEYGPYLPGPLVIIWYHDKSFFFANDHR